MRNLILSGLALVLTCGLAAAGENLSAETLLPAHGDSCAYAPAMAFGKEVYLVAWEAGRNEKADIVGVRLDKSGKALDAKPFVICAAKDAQGGAFVTFGPSAGSGQGPGVFLVVWQDLRNEKDWDVYAARVSPEGKVLDPDGVLVAGGSLNQSEPAACFDGRGFLVLFANQLNERRIDPAADSRHPLINEDVHVFGVRLSAEGRPEGAPIFAAKPPPGSWWFDRGIGSPGLVRVGDGPTLAGAMSVGRRISLWNAAEIRAPEKPVCAGGRSMFSGPRFATDGKSVLAVWSTFAVTAGRSMGEPNTGMLFIPGGDPTRVPREHLGTGQPPKTPGRSLSEAFKYVRNPSPAWDGRTYVVAWDVTMGHYPAKGPFRHDVVFMRRVSAAGEPEGKDETVAGEPESPAFHPAAASDGAGTTVIAYERHPRTPDVPIKIAVRVLNNK